MSRRVDFSRSAQDLRQLLDHEMASRDELRATVEWNTKPIHNTLPRKPQVSIIAPTHTKRTTTTLPSSHQRLNGLSSLDHYAAEYFPTTFSAAYTLDSSPKPNVNLIPESNGLSAPAQPWRPSSSQRRFRSHSSKTPTEIDKLYCMVQDMPITASSSVAQATSYQLNLAKLRLNRLKIEEDHLLEVKRLEELERIRGPIPKWYELITPDFHYESHKNTELLKRRKDYQALYDYRMRLVRASKDFEIKTAFS